MASTRYIIFVLCLTFLPSIIADDCKNCGQFQYCCGTCDHRYCCINPLKELTDDCFFRSNGDNIITITSTVVSFIIFIIFIISCCACPCCCLYKMCRTPTPVVATTTTTTVMHAPYPPQPNPTQAYQGAQYPGYQPVPVQPGYGGQRMPSAPYQGQPYSPAYQGQVSGPPPPYQEGRQGLGYSPAQVPYSQAGYNAGELAYPPQPPTQPAYPPQPPTQPAYPPQPGYPPQPPSQPDCSSQPAYNPAYMEPPKTGY